MAALKDIAKRVGVSIRTVSRALKNQGYVRAEVREQVLAVARELNYRPNRAAQSLRTNRSFDVPVILSSMDELHLAKLAGFERVLRDAGYSVTVVMNLDRRVTPDSQLLRDALAARPAGLAFLGLGSMYCRDISRHCASAGVPSVALGKTGEGFSGVGIDRQQGVYDAVSYLVEQGHRKTAYLGIGDPASAANKTRRNGYKRALAEYKRSPLLIATDSNLDQFAAGRQAVHQLLGQGALPDAVQVYSDVMALGVLAGLRDWHRRAPEDVALVGFDDRTAAALSAPPLTTVAQPNEAVGIAAAEILLAGIRGSGPPTDGCSRQLPTTLIKRESG